MTTTSPAPEGITLDFSDAAWNEEIIQTLRKDAGPAHIATRAAERIAAKGFSLVDAKPWTGARQGGRYGRSSHYETRCTGWTLTFSRPDDSTEYAVTAIGSVATYTISGPYDRMPEHNGKVHWRLGATDETKAILGWGT